MSKINIKNTNNSKTPNPHNSVHGRALRKLHIRRMDGTDTSPSGRQHSNTCAHRNHRPGKRRRIVTKRIVSIWRRVLSG